MVGGDIPIIDPPRCCMVTAAKVSGNVPIWDPPPAPWCIDLGPIIPPTSGIAIVGLFCLAGSLSVGNDCWLTGTLWF